ncbi:MAG: hypothetical protein WBP45_06270 [Daejeonella sp.]
MFKQNSKYRLLFLILVVLVFGYQSVNGFYKFANNDSDQGMRMIFGIVFGMMTIIYTVDLIAFIKSKKALKQGHE